MATSTGQIGFGFDYQYSLNGGSSYSSFGQVRDITLPEHDGTVVDKSYIQMGNQWMLKRPGLINGGPSTFQLIYDKSSYGNILNQLNQDGRVFKVVGSDLNVTASTWVWSGFVSKVSQPVPMDNLVIVTVTVTVSGIITYTSGT